MRNKSFNRTRDSVAGFLPFLVKEGIHITLSYADGRFTGSSVCNRYFAGVTAAEGAPGSIKTVQELLWKK